MPTQADLIFNQELAAWVQAVGSVIAIFVAISVPLYLNRLELQRDRTLQNIQKQKCNKKIKKIKKKKKYKILTV